MTEAAERALVCERALAWLRTPYHHRARIIGVGVDCAQLPAAVYEEAGLIPHIAPKYSGQWFLHHDAELYLEWVRPYAREIAREEARPGDLGIWRFGRTYSHGAIIIDPPLVVHALLAEGAVVLGDMGRDIDLASRPARFFTLWGRDGLRTPQ